MAHDYKDLKKALAIVAKKAESKEVFHGNIELSNANKAAVEVFTSDGPVYRKHPTKDGRLNITLLSLFKTEQFLRQRGVDWPLFDWNDLIDWLYKNWHHIIRILLSLLILVL